MSLFGRVYSEVFRAISSHKVKHYYSRIHLIQISSVQNEDQHNSLLSYWFLKIWLDRIQFYLDCIVRLQFRNSVTELQSHLYRFYRILKQYQKKISSIFGFNVSGLFLMLIRNMCSQFGFLCKLLATLITSILDTFMLWLNVNN